MPSSRLRAGRSKADDAGMVTADAGMVTADAGMVTDDAGMVTADAGMVTAELAACLPVVVLLVAVAVFAVNCVAERVRLQDAAREAARAAGRGDAATGRRLASRLAPGARVSTSARGDEVVAVASARVTALGGLLPGVTLTESCVAAREPGTDLP